MKYFIGYLLHSEAGQWYNTIAKKIADTFNTWSIHEKLPPHITIFYPEGVEDITAIRNYCAEWVTNNPMPGNIHISAFDHFDDRVVFAKTEVDESATNTIDKFREGIKIISGVTTEDFPIWHPHATLAYKLTPPEIEKIWDYVSHLDKPDFTIPFDNITLFKFVGDRKWVVEETFYFSR